MNRVAAFIQALGMSLVMVGSCYATNANPEQANAIAEIKKLGGKVTVDERSPDKPAISRKFQQHQNHGRWAGTP